MLVQNKKGISEIISYVLMVIIAIGISVLVYNYLFLQIPKEAPSCQNDVSLSIHNYTCINGKITISLYNSGLFKIDGAYIRIGNPGDKTKTLLNADDLFFLESLAANNKGLLPAAYETKSYKDDVLTTGTHILEIEPAEFVGNDLALCDRAIISQTISCGTAALSPQITSTSSNSPAGSTTPTCTANEISVNGVCETKSCANGGLTTGCVVAGCYGNGTAWGGASGCGCLVSSGTAETTVCPSGSTWHVSSLTGDTCAIHCSSGECNSGSWWIDGTSYCSRDCGDGNYASAYEWTYYPLGNCTTA